MKKIIISVFIIMLISLNRLIVSGQSTITVQEPVVSITTSTAEKNDVFSWRKIENSAFKQGEKLYYNVSWGVILAGSAEMRLDNIEEINGRKAYHLVAESRSMPFFDIFYKVRNTDESWIDVESICSHKYQKHQLERDYVKEEIMLFDNEVKKFIFTEKSLKSTPVIKEGTIPHFVQDILSALYYVRTLNLEVGKEYFINAQSGEKGYPLKVVVYKKEKVSVPAGCFDCFFLEPFITGDGLFKAKGRLWVWMTADERRIPVLLRSKIVVGSVSAELIKVEN